MTVAGPPLPAGVRLNAGTIAVGDYSPPVTALYVTTGGSLVVTMAGNGQIVNFNSVAVGTWITDVAISNIGTAGAAGYVFW